MNEAIKKPKVGDYFAARYCGRNGDLILGQVKQVKRDEIMLVNLLTGERSIKAPEVLAQRNARVNKLAANAVQVFWLATKDRQRTRRLATLLTR